MAKVTMPQLGESVAEGTIGKWLKQPGDTVAKYEPLLEVITDKVNAEVPSPFAGVLKEILAEEGATVPNNAEIAVIETEDEAGGAGPEPVALEKEAAPSEVDSGGPQLEVAATADSQAGAARTCRRRGRSRRTLGHRVSPGGDRRCGCPHEPRGAAPPSRARADRRSDHRHRPGWSDHPR